MDWPTFALITYAFFLLLTLVLFWAIAQRRTRAKYEKRLEEKEQKLLRMQIDLEETLEALDAYAGQMRTEWESAEKQGSEQILRIQKHELKTSSMLMECKSRITALEVQLRTQNSKTPDYTPIDIPNIDYAPDAPFYDAPGAVQGSSPEEEAPDIAMQAFAMLQEGTPADDVAKTLGLSKTELSLLRSRQSRI